MESNDLFKFYKVGGCVRDILLGIKPEDTDYTVVFKGYQNDNDNHNDKYIFEKLSEYLEKDYTICVSTPKYFTIKARKKNGDNNIIDFVLARKEYSYLEGTRSPVLDLGNIYDDLIRRDFTINALAIDCDTGEILDVCGGLSDIQNKILKTIKDPNTSLLEDPLRLLRGLRFSITKGFELEDRFLEALSNENIWIKLNKVVSPGRVRHELNKMFEFNTVKTIFVLNRVQTCYNSSYVSIFKDITLKPCVENNKVFKSEKN